MAQALHSLPPLTPLQELYWQRQSHEDARLRLENRIKALMKRNKQPRKLLQSRNAVIAEINAIAVQMRGLEYAY